MRAAGATGRLLELLRAEPVIRDVEVVEGAREDGGWGSRAPLLHENPCSTRPRSGAPANPAPTPPPTPHHPPRDRIAHVVFRYPARPAVAALERHRPAYRRAKARGGRPLGCRQDQPVPAPVALLPGRRGPHPHRRPRHPRPAAAQPARAHRPRPPGPGDLLPASALDNIRYRPPRCRRRRGDRRRARRGRRRVHRPPARGLRRTSLASAARGSPVASASASRSRARSSRARPS